MAGWKRMRIRIRKADRLFSRYIRHRDKWICQRCGKQYPVGAPGLHAAHMFSRRNESTRFDPRNLASCCFGCHSYLDSHPVEKIEFFKARLGEEEFSNLRVLTNQFQKKDDQSVILWCQEVLKQYE